MSRGRVYLIGLSAISVVALAGAWLGPETARASWLVSALVAIALQGPLGWWLVTAVGTPRFLGVWVMGMLARFAILGVMALVVLPRAGWALSPGLLVVGGVLFALLLLEGLVLWLEHSQVEAR